MDRESLVRVKATLDIDLHPSKLSDIHAGVQDHLNSMLLRYDNTLGGAVLAYTNDRLLGHQAPVHPYFSYVRVRVKTDLLLFKPKAKQTMVGRVTKTGHDFVSLLVMGVFNAVIPAEQMSRRFRRSDVGNSWKRKTGAAGEEIVVGTHVRFVVMRVKNNGGYFSIHGSLAEMGTGVVLAAEAGEQQLPGSCSPGTAANPEPAAAAVRDREDGVTEGQRHLQAKAHANNGGTTEADQQAAEVVPPKTKKRKKLAAAEARDGKRKKAARKASLDSVGRL